MAHRCRRGASTPSPPSRHSGRSANDPLADGPVRGDCADMSRQIPTYEFIDGAFVVGSDPIVCVVPLAMLDGLMTVAEMDEAFSGHASYRQAPWMRRYVGVWGRKNCQRLRRFLRERGADVVIHRERPPHLGLGNYKTAGTRKRVRSLDAVNGS